MQAGGLFVMKLRGKLDEILRFRRRQGDANRSMTKQLQR
jgi:hypothetical protein